MPTVQGTDPFEHGSVAAPPFSLVFGAPTIVTSPTYPHGGVKTLSVVTTGGNIGVRYNISATPDRGWQGIAFRITSDWVEAQFATIGAVAGNTPRLALNASRQIYGFFTGGGTSSVPSTALDLDEWHWLEMIFNVTGTTRNCYWRLNGVDQDPFDKSGESASTASYAQFLSFSGDPVGGTLLMGLWKWGSAAADDDWLGEPPFAARSQHLDYDYAR